MVCLCLLDYLIMESGYRANIDMLNRNMIRNKVTCHPISIFNRMNTIFGMQYLHVSTGQNQYKNIKCRNFLSTKLQSVREVITVLFCVRGHGFNPLWGPLNGVARRILYQKLKFPTLEANHLF